MSVGACSCSASSTFFAGLSGGRGKGKSRGLTGAAGQSQGVAQLESDLDALLSSDGATTTNNALTGSGSGNAAQSPLSQSWVATGGVNSISGTSSPDGTRGGAWGGARGVLIPSNSLNQPAPSSAGVGDQFVLNGSSGLYSQPAVTSASALGSGLDSIA